MHYELEDQLYQNYPVLYSRLTGFDCNDGWYSLIKSLSQALDPLVREITTQEQPIYISQVKEKFGLLRVYINSTEDSIENLISAAECSSSKICEICGKQGELSKFRGLLGVRCEEHQLRWP